MSFTNLQLTGTYLAQCLHQFFGTKRPIQPSYKLELSLGLGEHIPSSQENIDGHLFMDPKTGVPKDYWVEDLPHAIILTTSAMAHGDLAGSKGRALNTHQYKFNFENIRMLVEKLQKEEKYKNKPIHLIIPRIETGAHEDHIVVEYRHIDGNEKVDHSPISLVIDSKPSPSGCLHNDIEQRIHTEKQGLFNSEDCGYHVLQTIPVLRNLIKQDTKINASTLLPALDKKDEKGRSYATQISISKLRRLLNVYRDRLNEGNEYHLTFKFFHFGCGASDKFAATIKILANIEAQEPDIFKGLNKKEIEAANDSTLGKVVDEYQNTIRNPYLLSGLGWRTT